MAMNPNDIQVTQEDKQVLAVLVDRSRKELSVALREAVTAYLERSSEFKPLKTRVNKLFCERRVHGLTVLTNNRNHFERIEGIRIESLSLTPAT
jgi:hypothetical protein